MKINGLKTKQTINGTVTEAIEGDLAVNLTKVSSTNPYDADGAITIHYNCNTEDGELLPGEFSPASVGIKDIPMNTPVGGITYGEFIVAFKEVAKYIVQMDIDKRKVAEVPDEGI